MNLREYHSVIQFLQSYCYCYSDKGNEIVVFCPYCDDAIRRSGRLPHGHLYISPTLLLFHCFRCETSGSVTKLLYDIGFTDIDILNQLSKHSPKYITSKTVNYRKKDDRIKLIEQKWRGIDRIEYLDERFGIEINWKYFLVFPDNLNGRFSVGFMNSLGNICCYRYTSGNKRYHIVNRTEPYFWKSLELLGICKRIILTEGVFDAIIYDIFNGLNDDVFICACLGKNYKSTLKWLFYNGAIYNKNITVELIFDSDVKYPERFVRSCKNVCNTYQNDIPVSGGVAVKSDVAILPDITRRN